MVEEFQSNRRISVVLADVEKSNDRALLKASPPPCSV